MQHPGDRGFQPFMSIGDHQLHATQPATSKLAQELDPERLGFGSSDFHAEDFASAIVVDADRDHDGDRDDAAGLTHLYISGIDPRTGSGGNRFPAAG